VCSGVKSILDIGATLERLETLGVGVIGYRTARFPAFYLADSGFPIDWQVHTAAQAAAVLRARAGVHTEGYGLILANPVDADAELDRALHDRVLADGLAAAAAAGIRGKEVTPFLLDHFHRGTRGASVATNVALVLANARLAGEVAVAYAAG
ncbi:MAG: pseudouridine-5'-phosphate glycosidase, partial [Actinomycetota bacterium]|nr:pseudouridine-5'-phosphate glycosidase [Actinomycetota bacterium]